MFKVLKVERSNCANFEANEIPLKRDARTDCSDEVDAAIAGADIRLSVEVRRLCARDHALPQRSFQIGADGYRSAADREPYTGPNHRLDGGHTLLTEE